jgi:hypothetical protein
MYNIMKRLIFTLTAMAIFLSCQAQNQKARVFPNGIKLLGDPVITTVPATSQLIVLDQDGFSNRISYPNFVSQLNISASGGGTSLIEITQTEYDLLNQQQKDTTDYLIYDEAIAQPYMLKTDYDADDDGAVDAVDALTVGATQLQADAVTSVKIANNAVTGTKISDGSVGTSKISDNAVTEAKLSSGLYEPRTTFSPTFYGDTSDTFTTLPITASYTRFGDQVTFRIEITSINGACVGALRIGNLPYSTPGGDDQIIGGVQVTGISQNFYSVIGFIGGSSNVLSIYYQGAFDGSINQAFSDVSFSGGSIFITGTYITN